MRNLTSNGGRAALLIALTSAATLIAAQTAWAGTASVSGGELRYVAAGGEPNRVNVSRAGGSFRISDAGAPVVAVPLCVGVGGAAICPSAGIDRIVILLGDGNDSAAVAPTTATPATVAGADGDDRLVGGLGADTLAGGRGDDYLDGRGGGDALVGGEGTDKVSYSSRTRPLDVSVDSPPPDGEAAEGDDVTSVEVVLGGAGADHLRIRSGATAGTRLVGGDGNDVLEGARGDDVLVGGSGEDRMSGAQAGGQLGRDTLNGGGGIDTADFSFAGRARVVVGIDGLRNDGIRGDRRTKVSAEGVIGGAGDDLLVGDARRNRLEGRRGEDVLIGRKGSDHLVGGGSLDILQGGRGDDVIAGGAGFDFASYFERHRRVTVRLDGRRNDGARGERDLVRADVEGATGGTAGDVMIGNPKRNAFVGYGGPDRLVGRGGRDTLVGLGGGDRLLGGDGPDILVGRKGRDRFRAGAGPDSLLARDGRRERLRCGPGNDEFRADRIDRTRGCEIRLR